MTPLAKTADATAPARPPASRALAGPAASRDPRLPLLDPFVGSGTAALEAQLLGIHCVGIDVSPLCVLQARVKTESVQALPEILAWKDRIAEAVEPLGSSGRRGARDPLHALRDERARNFFRMARLVALSDQVRRRRRFEEAFQKNLERMVGSVLDHREVVEALGLRLGRVDLRAGDARALPLAEASVEGIITSPPYSIALDYVANDAHALRELGEGDLGELRDGFIGVRGTGEARVALYNEDMRRSLQGMWRVLKPGRCAVIGNATYLGAEVPTVRMVTDEAERLGFQLLRDMDKIIFGLYNVMINERILFFRKPAG